MICKILFVPNFLTFRKTLAEEGETGNSKALQANESLVRLGVYTFKQGGSSKWKAASSNKFYSNFTDGFCFNTEKHFFEGVLF